MLLGLYAKSDSLPPQAMKDALEVFSLGGKRSITPFERPRFFGAAAAGGGAATLPAHESNGLLAMASGHAIQAKGDKGLTEHLTDSLVASGAIAAPPTSVDGSFAFAAYKDEGHQLTLGNDAFGFHALFVVETADFTAFCTEYEPLLALPGVASELDEGAVAEYYLFGMTLANKTLIKGLKMLPAGTIRTYEDGGPASDRVHDGVAIKVDRSTSLEGHAKVVGEVFKKVVRRTSEAFSGAELSLTGGADTRLILSALTPEQRKTHSFVTHYGEKDAEHRDKDVVIAKKLAEAAALRHEVLFVEGGHSEFEPATFGLHRAKNTGDRTLAGVLGGEYLGGACVDVGIFPPKAVTREVVDRKMEALFEPSFTARLDQHPYDVLQADLDAIQAEDKELMFWINGFARPFFSQLYFGSAGVRTSTWMVPWQMHQRLYSPFADPEFLRSLLRVPFEYLSSYRLYNAVYKHVLPEFNAIPTNSGLAVRSDSVLKMYTAGEEPKRARIDRTKASRANGVERIKKSGNAWARGIYNRGFVESKLSSELATDANPTFMTRMKNVYTKSPFFKLRHVLPIHTILMKIKAKSETASAAELSSQLAPALVDFEAWCDYAGVEAKPALKPEPKRVVS